MKSIRRNSDLGFSVATAIAGAGCVIVSVTWKSPAGTDALRTTGFVLVLAGMALFLWAARHLGARIHGVVTPGPGSLVTSGPYCMIRHPAYLGLTVGLAGVALAGVSCAGLASVFLVFLPIQILRARAEDRALAEKFGAAWGEYAARVGFIVPRLTLRGSGDGGD